MSDIAIQVENLSKLYRIGVKDRGLLSERIAHSIKSLFSRNRKSQDPTEFWALRDINFEIKKGEAVGIIGKNGAGKSTLLKIISRITEPTTGKVIINGKVASLLEVGTGFHPELTGRENIYMNGAILGMKRAEIKQKFDEIVEFSGIGKFIDTPVKHYSSGMYVRLAFAVAAHLEPEILVVDEVLAVGDAEFQKKCLGKMGDVAKKEGRTILFVSHAMSAVKQLCSCAILLNGGRIEKTGAADRVVAYYLSNASKKEESRSWDSLESAPGNDAIRLLAISVRPADGGVCIDVESGIVFECKFYNFLLGRNIDCTIEVVNNEGVLMFHSGVILLRNADSRVGVYQVRMVIPPNLLNTGQYFVHVFWGENCAYLLYRLDEAISFDVENTVPEGATHKIQGLPGVIRPLLKWEYSFLQSEKIVC
ncbi:MAG: ABC transporter ATP-binding protein [Chloroherpetonaceae bacterium]|nr:ABC transporter ATP-binding protein [Chloroherpetonaceae bacterium]